MVEIMGATQKAGLNRIGFFADPSNQEDAKKSMK
jgi:hypothetical protein